MDWSNEKIPRITKLLPPKLKVVRWSFLKNSVISKKHHKRPVSVLPVSILPRMVLEHFKKASSTFSPVRALVSKNINSAVKKFILKIYYFSVVVFCVCNIIEHRQQTAFFQRKHFYINFGNKQMLQKLLHPMLSSKIWGTTYCNICKNYTYDREIYR